MFGYLTEHAGAPAKSRQRISRKQTLNARWAMIAVLASAGCLFLPGAPSASARASASHCRTRNQSKLTIKGATLRATITWKCGSVKVTGSALNRSPARAAVFIVSGRTQFGEVSVARGHRAKINTGWWATRTPGMMAGSVMLNVVVYTQPPVTRGVVVHRHSAR
jgi:hypothetical protein